MVNSCSFLGPAALLAGESSDGLIIDFAKEAIHPNPLLCDWRGCHAQLNSWKALQEHLHRHCQQVDPSPSQQMTFECEIPRCSGRFHSALHDIQQHIDLSHMTRVLLPCPIQDCPYTFGRNAYGLPEHFRGFHPGPFIEEGPRGHCILRTRWRPHFHCPESLSSLPEGSIPVYMLTSPIIHPSQLQRGWTPASSQNGRRGRRRRMHVEEDASPPAEEESSLPLPDLLPFDLCDVPEITMRHRQLEPMLQQSRPQHMIVPPVLEPEPPATIGYAAFAARYMELEKAGIIVDGTGIWPGQKKAEEGSTKRAAGPANGSVKEAT
ncbi:hypothetical protein GY45DRAFT_1242306 [Cubamyces sp. BRFM 1775]|nr:hypothetical protein GY45DRAFT_1242306 [Cubamyces sp. BRFM 1775]